MQRKRGLELGRPFGTPLLVHRSWLGAAALLVAHLALTTFGADPLPTAVVFGAAAAAGIFMSLLVHEGAHALARRWVGIQTADVTLFVFGGIARTHTEPRRGDEAAVALTGPLVSAAVGIGALAASSSLAGRPSRVVWTIAIANLVLAGLNVLPAIPFDGGTVLTAYLSRHRSRQRSVRAATRWGRVFGIASVMAGGWLLVTSVAAVRDAAIGLWLVLIGGFVLSEAVRAQRAWLVSRVTEDGTAGTWARPFTGKIRSETLVPADGGPYAVSDGSRLAGVLLPAALSSGRGQRARDVMIPWTPDIALGADVPITSALQRLASSEAGVLVVLDEAGVVRGVIDTEGVRARFGQS